MKLNLSYPTRLNKRYRYQSESNLSQSLTKVHHSNEAAVTGAIKLYNNIYENMPQNSHTSPNNFKTLKKGYTSRNLYAVSD